VLALTLLMSSGAEGEVSHDAFNWRSSASRAPGGLLALLGRLESSRSYFARAASTFA
jgi:hypothetical protein